MKEKKHLDPSTKDVDVTSIFYQKFRKTIWEKLKFHCHFLKPLPSTAFSGNVHRLCCLTITKQLSITLGNWFFKGEAAGGDFGQSLKTKMTWNQKIVCESVQNDHIFYPKIAPRRAIPKKTYHYFGVMSSYLQVTIISTANNCLKRTCIAMNWKKPRVTFPCLANLIELNIRSPSHCQLTKPSFGTWKIPFSKKTTTPVSKSSTLSMIPLLITV